MKKKQSKKKTQFKKIKNYSENTAFANLEKATSTASTPKRSDKSDLINFSFDPDTFSEKNKSLLNVEEYEVNKEVLSDDIKMMHEFIEFKYFKKVMKRNNNIFE